MAEYGILSNCEIHAGGYRLSGNSNRVSFTVTPDIRDRSTFGDLGKVRGYGLQEASMVAAGFCDLDAGGNDTMRRAVWDGDTTVPVSLFLPATSGAAVVAGDRAFFFNAIEPQYTADGQHGEDLMFEFNAQSASGYPINIGYVLNPGLVPVTADNTPAASIVELTDVDADEYLYGILHVTGVSLDDTIVVKIESDNLVGFADPTARITFASKAAIGGEYAVRIAGPIADTFWRAYADITGAADVSITFACAMAIQHNLY